MSLHSEFLYAIAFSKRSGNLILCGDIVDGVMQLNQYGEIDEKEWM